jgi:hypothetical protein
VEEISGLVTWTCEGSPCCSWAWLGSSCHILFGDRVRGLVTRLTGIVLERIDSGLDSFETEFLIATAMVVNLVVHLVVGCH